MNTSIPFHPGDKVVCYVRYSGGMEQGLKDRSTKEQALDIKKFCDANNLILYHVYEDAGISGTSTKGRDAFFEMINFLKQKPRPNIQGVVVWSLSRFARDLNTAQLYKAELRHYGYTIYSLTEQLEDSATGILFETLIDWKNQMYSEEVGAHVSRALRTNFEQFKVIPGVPPIGYIRIPVELPPKKDGTKRIGYRYEPDPALMPTIRKMFEMKANGASNSQILREIKIYKTASSLNDAFNRQIYYGAYEYGGVRIENYCQPIVTRDLWEKVNVIRMKNQESYTVQNRYRNDSIGLLNGMLVCADCGKEMSVNRRMAKGHEYRSYRCYNCHSKQIRCDKIDPVVIEKVENEILSEENLKKMVEAYLEYSRNLRQYNDEPDYSVQLEEVERKIENVINAIADMGNTDLLRKKLLELQTQQAVIRDTMIMKTETLKSETNLFEDIYDRAKKIISVLQDPDLPLVTKNAVLRSFIARITPTSENSAVIQYSLPGISWEGSKAPPEGHITFSQQCLYYITW